MELIRKVYQRSSINQLLFAIGFFSLIVMNLQDAVVTFQLKDAYLNAFYVVIFLGLAKVVDMGTGVNAQIIATSTYCEVQLFSGIVLLSVMLPLSYILTKEYGIVGTAVAQLISISIYNLVRVVFLWNKFRLQPFSRQTVYTILLGAACFALSYWLFMDLHSWAGLFARSIFFCVIFSGGAIYMNLSPDIQPVLKNLKSRIGWKS